MITVHEGVANININNKIVRFDLKSNKDSLLELLYSATKSSENKKKSIVLADRIFDLAHETPEQNIKLSAVIDATSDLDEANEVLDFLEKYGE